MVTSVDETTQNAPGLDAGNEEQTYVQTTRDKKLEEEKTRSCLAKKLQEAAVCQHLHFFPAQLIDPPHSPTLHCFTLPVNRLLRGKDLVCPMSMLV